MQKMLSIKLVLKLIVLKRNLEKDMDLGNCQNLLFMKGMEIRVHALLKLETITITVSTILLEIMYDLFNKVYFF